MAFSYGIYEFDFPLFHKKPLHWQNKYKNFIFPNKAVVFVIVFVICLSLE